ncbi:hypothetical protein VKT23_010325 [Stygiomarasmius scandens]|uniref:DUF6699 domain-containing protein n=1 Tax=Marasmiellus scandens TaxID=2682957 RepID=A0ABR1JC79_9AGAR
MSGPYVYVPPQHYPSSNYADPTVYTPVSPFIPNAALYRSPYTDNIPLPDSPSFSFTELPSASEDSTFPNTPLNRPRRGSWHVEPSYLFYTPPSPFSLPLPDTSDPFYRRRHSFSLYPQPAIRTWDPYYPPFLNSPVSPAQLHIHPWLNAQTWNGEFLFNLADRRFNPMRRHVAGIMRTTSPSGMDILCQAATYPPLNRLRIICDIIPQWSIDLRHQLDVMSDGSGMNFDTTRTGAFPPITLLDILIRIYQFLQTRITHVDWAKLTFEEETAVSKAYRKRCHAAGSTGTIGSREAVQAELAQGVKRVDFLLGKIWFKGCVMDLERGIMRLIVGKKS